MELNNLQKRIRVRMANPDGPLIALDLLGIQRADFVMCNPPFYSSKQEMDESSAAKGKPPYATCTGADVEMIYKDGELGFVLQMFEESKKLRTRVQWYSCMVGKLKSADAVITKLREDNVSNWVIAPLQPGNVTKRWAVAWSYVDLRPCNVSCGSAISECALTYPSMSPVRG